jgi:hypothetical protein
MPAAVVQLRGRISVPLLPLRQVLGERCGQQHVERQLVLEGVGMSVLHQFHRIACAHLDLGRNWRLVHVTFPTVRVVDASRVS